MNTIDRSIGVTIFAISYFFIGLFFSSILFINSLLLKNDMLIWYDYFIGKSNFAVLALGACICMATGILFIIASVLILKLKQRGYKMVFILLVIYTIFGMYFFLPLLIAHMIFFNDPRVRSQFNKNDQV